MRIFFWFSRQWWVSRCSRYVASGVRFATDRLRDLAESAQFSRHLSANTICDFSEKFKSTFWRNANTNRSSYFFMGAKNLNCARSKFSSVKIQLIFQIWCKFLINMLDSIVHAAIERFTYFLKRAGRARPFRVVCSRALAYNYNFFFLSYILLLF